MVQTVQGQTRPLENHWSSFAQSNQPYRCIKTNDPRRCLLPPNWTNSGWECLANIFIKPDWNCHWSWHLETEILRTAKVCGQHIYYPSWITNHGLNRKHALEAERGQPNSFFLLQFVARLLRAYQVKPSYKCITPTASWKWRWSQDRK